MIRIRLAEEADAAALRDIYRPYIDTPVTFETEIPTVEEFRERIRDIRRAYPYLVCEKEGRIVGYAYAHRFRERAAYRWGAELSVYIEKEHHGMGIGRALYTALIELLHRQRIQTVYGSVTQPNERSNGLHRSLGFRTAGVYRRTGFKCGQWLDVQWYEKEIGSFPGQPDEIIPIGALDAGAVQAVLDAAVEGQEGK